MGKVAHCLSSLAVNGSALAGAPWYWGGRPAALPGSSGALSATVSSLCCKDAAVLLSQNTGPKVLPGTNAPVDTVVADSSWTVAQGTVRKSMTSSTRPRRDASRSA